MYITLSRSVHFCASSRRFRAINELRIWPSKSKSMSRGIILAMTPFHGKYQNLQKPPVHFCAISYRFRDIKMYLFNFKKVGQDHGVQFSQLHHSMAKVKIYKCLPYIFALDLTVFTYQNFKFRTSKKYVNVMKCNFCNYTIRWQMSPTHFWASSYRVRDT